MFREQIHCPYYHLGPNGADWAEHISQETESFHKPAQVSVVTASGEWTVDLSAVAVGCSLDA